MGVNGKTFIIGLLLLTACATTGINRYQPNLFSTEEEVRMGAEFAKEVERQERLLPDVQIQNYVDQIGQRIAALSDRPNIKYHFKVIDKPDQVNAFALPGGYIYVYSGLLKRVESEAELAGVLAHEIGHVAARHATERLTLMYGYQLGVSLLLGEDPSEIAKLVSNLFGVGGLLAYSRRDEYEADRLGVQYANSAGYDPNGLLSFLKKLKEMEKREPGLLEQLLSTHPPTSERIKRVREQIARLPQKGTRVNRERYLRMRRRLE